jgi:hypothetical protein
MKTFLAQLWAWLNGNKTLIGALILAILGGGFIAEGTLLYTVLEWLGGILAGGGLLHKLAKGVNNT